jgi:asparagine synthase (glutamine-hydrolysing)
MCGIFIAYNHLGLDKQQEDSYKHAIAIADHRGPDNIGHFVDDNCFMGHSRLAILDLDKTSNQPFRYGDLVLTYNGEVFNYEELRIELTNLGHNFHTESDTEVVITAYAQWGVDCFSRFNGMWALAIYDIAKSELVVSRDRFGQKPLFVSKCRNTIYIASEFQQLAALVEKDIDFGLIQMFLKEGTYEGDGRTFLQTIQEFPKAHCLRINDQGDYVNVRYWNYWNQKVAQTDEKVLETFNKLLSDSVRLRLRSDVPFGILVSGGVDSTLIANYAREHAGDAKQIKAFAYSSGDLFDEQIYAKIVADRLNLELHIHTQDTDAIKYKTRLRKLVQHLGRGHSSPAIVSIDYLYQSVASNGVRVALDGQGADELLAGYKTYFILVIPWYLIQGRFKQAYLALKDQFSFGFLQSLILFLRNVMPPFFKKIMRMIYGYERLFSKIHFPATQRWIKDESDLTKNPNMLNRYLIMQHSLGLENLLYYGDIVAMGNSIENRSPFMDHRLVDYAFAHDDKLKLYDAIDKYALRTSAPYTKFSDILDRKKFGFPSEILLSTKKSMVEELRKSKIFDWPIFDKKIKSFVNSEKLITDKYERLLFRLYQVHAWNDIFIHGHAVVMKNSR